MTVGRAGLDGLDVRAAGPVASLTGHARNDGIEVRSGRSLLHHGCMAAQALEGVSRGELQAYGLFQCPGGTGTLARGDIVISDSRVVAEAVLQVRSIAQPGKEGQSLYSGAEDPLYGNLDPIRTARSHHGQLFRRHAKVKGSRIRIRTFVN